MDTLRHGACWNELGTRVPERRMFPLFLIDKVYANDTQCISILFLIDKVYAHDI